MSDHATVPEQSLGGTNEVWSTRALVVGIGLIAIAISGLLDDSGLAEHPYWVVPAAVFLSGCVAIAARTLQRLVRPPD